MIQNEASFALQDDLLLDDDEVTEISEGIQEIDAEAFQECSSLKQVSAAHCTTLRKIGYGAFWNCHQLVQVNLTCQEEAGCLEEIADMAFCGCTSLQSIEIPVTVLEIGRFAFQECKSLISMNLIPPRLELLGQYAFAYCSALSRISIPSTLKLIDNHCFSYCRSLLVVELHNGLTHIGEYAFLDCISLSAISIPESTVLIGAGSFSECVNLLGVELPIESTPSLELEAFRGCRNLVNFYNSSLTVQETMDREAFAGCSRLLLGMNNQEKIERLRDRFRNFPVHRACYHASTTTIESILAALTSAEDTSGCRDWKDAFGMTPFHVASTSAILRTDILQVLLDHLPLSLLAEKDYHGRTMMDYLLVNRVPGKSFQAIKFILAKTLVEKLEMLGWDNADALSHRLSSQIESMQWERHSAPPKVIMGEVENEDSWWEAEWHAAVWRRRQALREAVVTFERYAIIEVTSILELGLWKKSARSCNSSRNGNDDDRESSRMMCGSEVVVPNVIGFLGFSGGSLGTISRLIFDYDVSWISGSTSLE